MIYHITKQLGGAFGVVKGGMRLLVVERNIRRLAGFDQHRLTEHKTA